MSNYSSLFNQSFVDVDSLTTNTIISDSLILTAELDQLQLGQTIITDTSTTPRVGTIPPGTGNFEFVTTASGSQIINGDNTWTGINTFTSISGVYLNLLTPLSGSTIAIKGYQQGVIHSDSSGVLTSSPVIDADISGQIDYNKLGLSGKITNNDIVASAGIPYDKLNVINSITNADIFGGIVYGKLILSGMVNNNDIISNAGIPYSKITLTNSIVDGDIENSAAIQYSKLSLSGKITNSDIVGSAGIPYSKLSLSGRVTASDISSISGTNGQVLTASGGLASWTTVTATNATNALNIDINTYPLTYTETANRTPFYTHTTDGYNALKSSPLYYYVEKTGTIMPPTPDVKRLYVPSLNCSGVLYVDSDIISSAGTINLANGSVNVNNGNVTISGGSLISALDSTCTGSTAALNTSTTAIATTEFTEPFNNAYKNSYNRWVFK
jgi:hypothetical protein